MRVYLEQSSVKINQYEILQLNQITVLNNYLQLVRVITVILK